MYVARGTKVRNTFVSFFKNEETVGTEATPSEISRHSQKFEKQFSLISSYFLELNTSVPTS